MRILHSRHCTASPDTDMATVLVLETPGQRTLEIECSGAARDMTTHLLESLPIPLEKGSGAVWP